MTASAPSVQFCYRCGKRVDPSKLGCWYCGARTQRELRVPRKCPFCSEVIAFEAIKCRHCGEFLDGREQAAPPQQQPQMVYIVDAAMLRGMQGGGGGAGPGRALGGGPVYDASGAPLREQRLLPGQPVPPDVARNLDPETIHAIEHNRPDLLRHPGVRALPMPGAGPVMDVVPMRPQLAGGDDNESTALPARGSAPSAARRGIGRRLWGLFIRLLSGTRGPTTQDEDAILAADPYRRCESCGTEILTSDNYCYHCGMQYHVTTSDVKRATRVEYPSNSGRYWLILLLTAAMAWQIRRPFPQIARWYTDYVIVIVILLLCLGAFFRRRTTPAQLASILLAAIALSVFIVAKFTTLGF